MPIHDSDKPMAVLGVPGRLTHRTTKPDGKPALWFHQRWISEARPIKGYGEPATICAKIRFDDECGNGHNSFAITADVRGAPIKGRKYYGPGREIAGGCLHDEIATAFPELAPLIQWHLCATDGPMHYAANTIYLAGNRDHWGTLEGEPRQWETFIQFGANPIKHKPGLGRSFVKFLEEAKPHPDRAAFDFEVIRMDHDDRKTFGPKYTFGGFGVRWHECPFDNEGEALNFLRALQTCEPQFVRIATAWGEGKSRQLDSARRSAVWPDATDGELCREPEALRAALVARLPKLLADFRAAIEGAGFLWEPPIC